MSKLCIRAALGALRAVASNHPIRAFLLVIALVTVLPVHVQAQFTVLKNRATVADGSDGFSPVVFSNGKLFGTTRSGGQFSNGVVFSMNMDGTGYAVLHHFNGTDGSSAYSGVIVGTDGKLYGVTYSSNTGGGVIFRLNTDGTGFITLRVLSAADGSNCWAGLLQAADGKLYGAAVNGGASSRGTAFRLNLDGTGFTVLRNFDIAAANPYGTLIQGLDGKFYGTTQGATGGTGSIYRMNTDGTGFQILHTLISAEGSNPQAGVMQTSDGKLYGTVTNGGASSGGSVFKLNPDGTGFVVLKSFVSGSTTEGYTPYRVVPTLGTDGRIYGGNYQIGGSNGGTIWSINPDGSSFKIEVTLSSTVTGYFPLAGVQRGPDGVLYGQTYQGGPSSGGTIFRLTRPGIGVNFTGGQWALAATDQPGVQAGANWNNVGGISGNTGAGIGSNVALTDHGTLPTTARLTFRGAYDAGYGGYSILGASNAGTKLLYRGGIYGDNASREASATVTNIPYSYYDVYVYGSNESTTSTLSISNGFTTYYSQGNGADHSSVSALIETTSTNSASPTVGPAQYAVFRGLTSSSFTLTTGGSINGIVAASIMGFQIVPGIAPAVPAPTITSATTASATYNSSFSYQITASNSPTSFGATNLPAGLSVNASGLISGTITAAAGTSYNIGISATNGSGTGSATLVLTVNKASAAVVLSNLTQTYDGSTKSATVTTAPAGQPVDVSYTGAVLPPVAAGSYGVLVTIKSTSSYTGSASGTLAIQPAAATIALGSLAQFYDGSAKSVSATTTPPGLPVSITYNGSTTAPSGVGSYAVLATVTNPNYTGTASGTLTITDNVPPVLTLPTSPVVAEATSPAGASVTFTVSANDNVDGPVAVVASPVSGSTFPVGNTTVSATAHDAANNVANGSFTVSVVDTTPPVLTLPADQTIEATSAAGAVAMFAATATDAVSNVAFSYTIPSGSVFGLGDNSVGVTATDASGNASTGSFTVHVVDTTAPQIGAAANVVAEATSAAGAVVNFSTTASDIVDGAVAVTAAPASGSLFSLGNTTADLATQDAAGNIATSSFTVSVVDTTKPTLTLPANITAEATGPNGAAVSFSPTATDAVGVKLAGADFESPAYSADTHNYVSFGGVGTSGDWNFKGYGGFLAGNGGGFGPMTQVDGQQCAFVQSYYGTLSSLETSHTFTVVAGAKYVVQFQQATRPGYPGLDYNVTLIGPSGSTEIFRRSAASGEGWARYTATFIATTSGEYTLAFNNLNPVDDATFFIDDISFYSTAVPVVTAPMSGSTFALGTTAVNASATDTAGNAATGSFNVTVNDTTPPVLAVPANIVAEATSASGAVVTFASSATDIVDGSVAVAASTASGSTFPIGTTTVNLTTSDAHGNAATGTFTVTVRDTTAPVIAPQADLTAEATSAAGAIVNFAPTASDLVDGAVAVTASPVSGSTFALGTTTVSLISIDAAGNQASSSFSVTVRDTTGPVLTVPANLTLEATSANGAIATFAATASDTVSGVTLSYSIASGSTFALGTTTVNVTATDAAGNVTSGSFTVTVRDTTAPVIAPQANLVIEATGANGAVVTFAPSATDIVSGNVVVHSSIASGSTFPLGTTAVTLSTEDAAGNVSSLVFTVTVQDTTAPIVATQDNLIVEATSSAGAVVTFTPSAVDIVNGAVSVVASPTSGSTFALGTTTVTLTATDAAGNSSSKTFTVTVRDTTAPVISSPGNLVAEATSAAGAMVNFSSSASDLVNGAVSVSSSIASGSTFAIGTTTVTLTSTDAAGNTSTKTFTITVRDTTKPVLTLPSNQTLEATGPTGAVATFVASATDAVGATISYTVASGSTFALGINTVTVTATDAAGNTVSGSFTITVRDTTKPVLNLPASFSLEATSAAGAVATFTTSASDLVSGAVTVTLSKASGTTFAIGTTTVNASATDAAGNTITGSFVVTVRDTTAPVLTVPANQTLEATSASGATATFAASATDAVGATLTYSKASGSTFAIGTTVVTVTATDAAGNSSSGTFTVKVADTTKPVITSLTPSTASLWPANHKMVSVTIQAATTDVAGSVTTKIISATSSEPDNGLGDGDTANDIVITGAMTVNLRAERSGTGNGRTYSITVEAKDAAGNTSTRVVTVSVPKNQS